VPSAPLGAVVRSASSRELNHYRRLSGLCPPFDFVCGTDLKIGHYVCTGRGKPLPYKGIAKDSCTKESLGGGLALRFSALVRDCVECFGSDWEGSSGRVVLLLDCPGTDDFFP
jgi:hypothetical protein